MIVTIIVTINDYIVIVTITDLTSITITECAYTTYDIIITSTINFIFIENEVYIPFSSIAYFTTHCHNLPLYFSI